MTLEQLDLIVHYIELKCSVVNTRYDDDKVFFEKLATQVYEELKATTEQGE